MEKKIFRLEIITIFNAIERQWLFEIGNKNGISNDKFYTWKLAYWITICTG